MTGKTNSELPNSAPLTRGRVEGGKTELLAFTVVVTLGMAARLSLLHSGIWLDEAWVANSILAPTVRQMLYYDRWVQSSPPLFLLLDRVLVHLLGASELSLRALPWLAAAIALALFAWTLRRIFPFTLALIGTTLLVTNYWAFKYAQQVKQYSTDLLVACVFLCLLSRSLESEAGAGKFLGLLATGSIGVLLSFPAVFWFPAAALVPLRDSILALRQGGGERRARENLAKLILLLVLFSSSLAVTYFFFSVPNQLGSVQEYWRRADLGGGGLFAALFGGFPKNVCRMLFPQRTWSTPISYFLGLLAGAGLVRAMVHGAKREPQALRLLVVTLLPFLAAIAASVAHRYPLRDYPRFILWMLPSCILLILYCLEAVWTRLAGTLRTEWFHLLDRVVAPAGCLVLLCGGLFFLIRYPGRGEDVRSAVMYLKAHAAPADLVFVHGGTSEQFDLYAQLLHWSPGQQYLGKTGWPCCPRHHLQRVSSPRAASFEEDVHSFLDGARGKRVWVIMPAANPSEWSQGLRYQRIKLPGLLAAHACQEEEEKEFDNVALYTARCNSARNDPGR
ncbi:MAG TPA: glycosyltransferase family 39 protein [Candidatus Acidoferrum sp.]|nr:glycosyltransferase family 39 protein [Candidatus Acidoferrum sp.]